MLNQNSHNSFIDKIIEGLLYSLLAFMPLAFGTVEAWSQQVLIIVSGVIGILFLIKVYLDKGSSLVLSFAYIPVILFVLLVMFQLLRLPASVAGVLSPNTASIKQELLGDLSRMPLTFYPDATVIQLRLVLAIALLFFVVLNVFTTVEKIKRLLLAIIIVGAGVSFIVIAQVITFADKIYWVVPIPVKLADAGPFVNHSNFGQFMNLSIGAAIGLLFVLLHEFFTGRKFSSELIAEYFDSENGKRSWFLLLMIVAGTASIMVSLTRGGMVSLLVAGAFTILLITTRQSIRSRGWLMVVMALGAFICVLYIGFDAVYDRLATLRELQDAQGGRLQILKDILLAWTRFPLFGTGLGTHEVVYPMFDRSTIAALAAHAENEYAQTAEETGILGLSMLFIFGSMVWFSFARNIRSAYRPIKSAAYGLGFGLLAILIHSLSDFGQHLPANACLSAIFCALLIGLTKLDDPDHRADKPAGPIARYLVTACLVFMVAALWWFSVGVNDSRVGQSHWKRVIKMEKALSKKNWQGTNAEFIDIIGIAAKASNLQPGNAHYLHWLNVYRWRSMIREVDPETGVPVMPEGSEELFIRLINEFEKVTVLCPTFGPSYCMAGQLQQFIGKFAAGKENIEKGYSLAPCDATVCFVAGMLDVTEAYENAASDLPDPNTVIIVPNTAILKAANDKFKRAVELDGRFFDDAADIYISLLNRPDLAVDLAGDQVWRLTHVANHLYEYDIHSALTDTTRIKILGLLEQKCSQSDVTAGTLASLAGIYRRQGQSYKAIEHYQRALILDYGNISWRLALANLLAQDGSVADAIHEAKICLRLKPQYQPAITLIEKLSILPEAVEN